MRVEAGKEDLTLAEALNQLSDAKAARRKAAAEGLNEALAARTQTMALVLNTVAADKALEDRWRGFKRPADGRHLANEVDGEVGGCDGRGGGRRLSEAVAPLLCAEGPGDGQGDAGPVGPQCAAGRDNRATRL